MVLAALLVARAAAAEAVFPDHESFAPSPPILALATQAHVPVTGFVAPARGRVQPAPGDRCVVLVSLRDGREVEQWLLDFQVGALTTDEAAEVAAVQNAGLTLYTSTGTKLDYGLQPVAMEVVVRGPLDVAEKRVARAVEQVTVKRARLVVNGEYLALGLDRAAATIVRLRSNDDGKVGFGVSNTPPDPAAAAADRARLEAKGLTAADERAMAGAVPALMEFFRLASQTPALREILFKVVDVPWLALIKGLGSMNGAINLEGNGIRAVAEASDRFIVPLRLALNGADALVAELEVRRPVAPASTLAGISAIYAGAPNGKGERLSIELLATAVAGPPAEGEAPPAAPARSPDS